MEDRGVGGAAVAESLVAVEDVGDEFRMLTEVQAGRVGVA